MVTVKISLNSIDKVKSFVNDLTKFKSIGLERSREKIPIMDFASITYLPETRSKSESNLVRSFTSQSI